MKATINGLSSVLVKKGAWKDITIADFFSLKDIDDYPNLTALQKKVKKISLCTGLSEDDFRKYNANDLTFFYDNRLSFLDKAIDKEELQDYYVVNGKKYKMVKNFDHMQWGQFKDMMTIPSEIENINNFLTIFLVPVKPIQPKQVIHNSIYTFLSDFRLGRKVASKLNYGYIHGDAEEYCETSPEVTSQELYDHLPITAAISMSVFFCQVATLYSRVTALFFDLKTAQELKSALTKLESLLPTQEVQDLIRTINLQLDGVGLFALMP